MKFQIAIATIALAGLAACTQESTETSAVDVEAAPAAVTEAVEDATSEVEDVVEAASAEVADTAETVAAEVTETAEGVADAIEGAVEEVCEGANCDTGPTSSGPVETLSEEAPQ